MGDDSKRPVTRRAVAVRVTAGYAAAGVLWIALSDWAAHVLFPEASTLARAEVLKGWLFVAVTAAALYAVLRRAEGALERSEGRHRALLDSLPCGLLVVDGGKIVYANPGAAALLGCPSKEDLKGRALSEILAPSVRDTAGTVARILSTPPGTVADAVFRGCGGDAVPVEVGAAPMEFDGRPATQLLLREAASGEDSRGALRESRERYRALVEALGDWIWEVDAEGRYSYSSPQVTALLGYTPEEVLGKTPFDFMPPEEGERVRLQIAPLFEARAPLVRLRNLNLHRDGRRVLLETSGSPVLGPGGEFLGYRGVDRDVTETEQVLEDLSLQKSYFRDLFENSPSAIVVLDNGDRVLSVNRGFTQLFQYEPEEILGHTINEILVPPHLQDDASTLSHQALGGEVVHAEGRRRRKDGALVDVSILGYPIVLGGSQIGVYGIYTDIGERKRTQERLTWLAGHDPLTGLPNRWTLQERLVRSVGAAAAKGHSLAVLFVDLDRFKEVNDTLGHQAGDKVLTEAAERLGRQAGPFDLLARTGSDEFVLVLAGKQGSQSAADRAAGLLATFAAPFTAEGQDLHLTPSIGIACYPQDGADADALLKAADMAMYRVKRQGGNGYQYFTSEMAAATSDRVRIAGGLRGSVERGELRLLYQPLVDSVTGQLTGAEALLRWHPQGAEMVLPTRFIPVAEETGLILPIGEWVLNTACAQNKAWQHQGLLPLRVAVNLSARQFQAEGLLYTVDKVLAETGLAPEFLELEITEGTAMADLDRAVGILKALRDLGVRVSLDDFGTGYSSMTYLRRLPIDTVKIDRAFVRDVVADSQDAAIVRAIVSMAKGLGLSVVAEGVETEAQVKLLHEAGCTSMQGYLFGRPMPPEELGAMVSVLSGPRHPH